MGDRTEYWRESARKKRGTGKRGPNISVWTPERVASLRRMIVAGKPPSEITAALNCTRTAASLAAQKYLRMTILGRDSKGVPQESRLWADRKELLERNKDMADFTDTLEARMDAANGSAMLLAALQRYHPLVPRW